MKLCQKRGDVVRFSLLVDKTSCIILDVLKNVKRGAIDSREDRVAMMNARHNETENKFDSCLSGEIFSNQIDAAKVIVTGFSSMRDKTLHGKCGIEVNSKILSRGRYWNICATQLKSPISISYSFQFFRGDDACLGEG